MNREKNYLRSVCLKTDILVTESNTSSMEVMWTISFQVARSTSRPEDKGRNPYSMNKKSERF